VIFALQDTTRPVGKVGCILNYRDEEGPFGWTMVGAPGTVDVGNDEFAIDGKQAADLSIALTAGWADYIRPIFTEQLPDQSMFLKMTTSSPHGVHVWENQPRVTLLGDAVHGMTPANGTGAQTACRDGDLLGRIVAKHGGWTEEVTGEYEKEMRVYAGPNVREAWERSVKLHGASPELIEVSR